jgi:hypothetical protein
VRAKAGAREGRDSLLSNSPPTLSLAAHAKPPLGTALYCPAAQARTTAPPLR